MMGQKEKITDHLSIIPIYKVKINFINLNTDIKSNVSDGSSGSVSITPVCLLEIKEDDIKIIRFEDKKTKDDFFEFVPTLISNINVNEILKGLKF